MALSRCSFFVLVLLQAVDIASLISWPNGKYDLLKPATGCPEEWTLKGWTDKGYVYQDTVDHNPSNNRSKILHIDGYVGPSFVMRYFCVKKYAYDNAGPTTWQTGQYCIHSRGYFNGMKWGSITMHGETNRNKDTLKYANFANRIKWYGMIQFYFYCHTAGSKKTPIELPITKPFYLLPYGSPECQQVKWMVATTEWIKYHTRDYKGHHDKYTHAPYYELGDITNKGITMYYCYYKSCNYTLTEKKGVFQSPGFPVKYPDGQLCSWRIMVPANHTIHVHFTSLSFYRNDTNDALEFYKRSNDTFKLNDTFFGHYSQPFTLKATSDLEFVFRTDQVHNSPGFRAEYNIFIPCESKNTHSSTTDKPQTTSQKTTRQTSTPQLTTQQKTTPQTTTPKKPTKESPITQTKPQTTKQQTFTNIAHTDELTTNLIQTTQTLLITTHSHYTSNKFMQSRVCGRDLTWRITVIVIPLVCCILIGLLVVDIIYRCRYRTAKRTANDSRSDNHLAVNMTYERGDILLSEPADTSTVDATVDANDDQPLSIDEPFDYEDLDYTQINEVPCPNLDNEEDQERYILEPICNNEPDVFYHVLEGPVDMNKPTYQNLAEVDQYTFNPVYEPAENSAPFAEVNKLYDEYVARLL